MSIVLVMNSGSSSLKYQLIDVASESPLAGGLIERIGEPVGQVSHRDGDLQIARELSIPNHDVACATMLALFAESDRVLDGLSAVGHRVVQGGSSYSTPVRITAEVETEIARLAPLAPLHNPANLAGIRAAREAFPALAHVAVFDTAFHQTMPASAYTYAIDRETAARYGIRRYGFHGTSHHYVSREAAKFLGQPLAETNLIVLHLGNGASACAVRNGSSIDTSMGLTPLAGLVMGTRSGDIDPGVLLHLSRSAGLSIDDIDVLLNAESGLKGLTGMGDMRDVEAAAAAGDSNATLALEVYVHRLRGYLGNYAVQLGRIDAIVFTGGVGENAAPIREAICADLDLLGIQVDAERNTASSRTARDIATNDSQVRVLVIPTNEELEIARQTLEIAR